MKYLSNTLRFDRTCLFCKTNIVEPNSQVNATKTHSHDLMNFSFHCCDYCLASLPRITHYCLTCNNEIAIQNEICGECLSQTPSWSRCLAAYAYKPPVNKLIRLMKFQNKSYYCSEIAHLMLYEFSNRDPNLLSDIECFIPIPTHKKRLKERGFNQSRIIAHRLTKLTNIKTFDCLSKTRNTPNQSELSKKERKRIKPIYTIKNPRLLNLTQSLKKVVLIDDVLTTGSTASSACNYLKKLGISNIEVWVFARTC